MYKDNLFYMELILTRCLKGFGKNYENMQISLCSLTFITYLHIFCVNT